MAYTPENNPYIPGDPYSYDLKWIVNEIKNHSSDIQALQYEIAHVADNIEPIIAAAVMDAFNSYVPVFFTNAQGLIEADLKNGNIAVIEGFYNAGDGGNGFYYITDDISALTTEFYITLDNGLYAVFVPLAPYVAPEMFGAHGDGIEDDKAAFDMAISYNMPVVLDGKKTYLTSHIEINNPIVIYGNNAKILQAPEVSEFVTISEDNVSIYNLNFDPNPNNQASKNCIVYADGISNLYMEKCAFLPQYQGAYDTIAAVYFINSTDIHIIDCELTGAGAEGLAFGEGCSNCEINGGSYHHNLNGSGIYCYSNTDHCKIIGANVYNNGGSNIGVVGDYHIIQNCRSYNGATYGMTIGHPPTGYATNCIIDNCKFENNSQRDIVVQMNGTKYNTISNCSFIGTSNTATNYGIGAASTPGPLTIQNCHFSTHRYAIMPSGEWSINNCYFANDYIDIYAGVSGQNIANIYVRNCKSDDATFFISTASNAANSWFIIGNITKRIKNSAVSIGSAVGAAIMNNQFSGSTSPASETGISITTGSKNQILGNYVASFKRGIYDIAADYIVANQCNANTVADYTITNAVINIANANSSGPI